MCTTLKDRVNEELLAFCKEDQRSAKNSLSSKANQSIATTGARPEAT
jgi:hypothetical protein